MPKHEVADLLKFLQPYSDENRQKALYLRQMIWDLYPQCNELIYDNYNAVAFGWSPNDKAGSVFCSIAVYGSGVNMGFNKGSELIDDENLLQGDGSWYRFIRVEEFDDFPFDGIKRLMEKAYANSLAHLKPSKKKIEGQTIIKSIADKKRRPTDFK